MQTELNQILSPRYRLLSHLLFWLCYLFFFTVMYDTFYDNMLKSFTEVASTLPVKMGATYLTLYLLIPRLLDQKKYLTFALAFTGFAIIFGFLGRLVLHIQYVPTYYPNYDYDSYPLTHLGKAGKNMISVYSVVLAATAIKLIKRNYQNEKIAQELNREKLDAELKFLKGQIHPHFLFNTLNNLYALTLQNSPKSSEVVLKLSTLLDYMLYECNIPDISLRKEIEQIKNLIELEKLRYGERLEVSLTTKGDISSWRVPPLMMMPFVENAFKHGVSKNIDNSFISIDIQVKNEGLILKVENSKTDDNQKEEGYTKGIGLKNVRRRLELIYQNRYDLQVFDEEETFMIVLRLPLIPVELSQKTQTQTEHITNTSTETIPLSDLGTIS